MGPRHTRQRSHKKTGVKSYKQSVTGNPITGPAYTTPAPQASLTSSKGWHYNPSQERTAKQLVRDSWAHEEYPVIDGHIGFPTLPSLDGGFINEQQTAWKASYIPALSCGEKVLANPAKVRLQGPEPGNYSSVRGWVDRFAATKTHPHFSRRAIASNVQDLNFVRAFGKYYSLKHNTHTRYLRQANEVLEFWKVFYPQHVHFNEVTQVVSTMQNCELLTAAFIIYRARQSISKSYLRSYRTAMNHIRKLANLPRFPDKTGIVSETLKAAIRLFAKPTKVTPAIPSRIMRLLLLFIGKTQEKRKLYFFMFGFFCASRASEMIRLHVNQFTWHNEAYHEKRHVEIWFPLTKTHQSSPDDGHRIIFYETKTKEVYTPYDLATRLYNCALKHDGYIAPFGGKAFSTRSKLFYAWFRDLKKDFGTHLHKTRKWRLKTELWRYHSVRTTFVGLMKKWGLTWEQIRLRTGHSLNSQCTQNTYFMNALMSEGFDEDFEHILEENMEVQELFGHQFQEGIDPQQHDPHDIQHEERFSPENLHTYPDPASFHNLPAVQELFTPSTIPPETTPKVRRRNKNMLTKKIWKGFTPKPLPPRRNRSLRRENLVESSRISLTLPEPAEPHPPGLVEQEIRQLANSLTTTPLCSITQLHSMENELFNPLHANKRALGKLNKPVTQVYYGTVDDDCTSREHPQRTRRPPLRFQFLESDS